MRVLIFVKYPRPGQVKTRLAACIGAEHACGLYRAFVRDQLETMRRAGLKVTVCCAPTASRADYLAWLGPEWDYLVQRGADLGQRMANALSQALVRTSPVVLIGSDLPDLPVAHLFAAQQLLETAKLCLGPTPDGGFYLIGLRTFLPLSQIFANVAWSTSQVLAQTLANCRSIDLCPHLAPAWSDVDTASDLGAFLRRNSRVHSASMAYARDHGLLEAVRTENLAPEFITQSSILQGPA